MEFTTACLGTNQGKFYQRTMNLHLSQHSQGKDFTCCCGRSCSSCDGFYVLFVFIFCFAHNPNKLMSSAFPHLVLHLPEFMLERPSQGRKTHWKYYQSIKKEIHDHSLTCQDDLTNDHTNEKEHRKKKHFFLPSYCREDRCTLMKLRRT